MSKFVFNRPLGDDMSPFGFSARHDTSWIGPAITATDNLFSRVENHWLQNRQQHFESDEAEKAYNRQRELSNELLDKQFDYSKQLWEANNEYNTPAHQSQLLREAGLNPYVYSHGSDIGTGVSGSPATTPNIGAPSVAKGSAGGYSVAPTHDVGSLLLQGSALNNDRMRSVAQLAQAYPKILESVGGDTKKAEEIMQSLSGFAGFNGDNSYQFVVAETKKAQAQARIESVKADISEVFDFDNAKLLNDNLHKESIRLSAEIDKIVSEKEFNEANKNYILEKVNAVASEIARNWAEAAHLHASKAQIQQLTKYLVRSAAATADMDEMDMWEDRANFNMGAKARQWMQSEQGQTYGLAQEIADDNYEAGLVEKIVRGRDLRRRSGRSKRK